MVQGGAGVTQQPPPRLLKRLQGLMVAVAHQTVQEGLPAYCTAKGGTRLRASLRSLAPVATDVQAGGDL